MRELMIALIVACTLISAAEAFYWLVTPANANFEAHDAAIDGLRIAVPPSMKKFPAELVPLS
jgi:Tfp pilus assembly protein PilW